MDTPDQLSIMDNMTLTGPGSKMTDCTYLISPNITTFLHNLTLRQTVVVSLSSVFLCGIIALYLIIFMEYVRKKGNREVMEDKYSSKMMFIQSTYMVYAFISYLCLLSPRSIFIGGLVFSVFLAFVFKSFLNIMLGLFHSRFEFNDNEEYSSSTFPRRLVHLAAPPLACCCCCICPSIKLSHKFITLCKIGVYQAVIIIPSLNLVECFLWSNGFYMYGIESKVMRIIGLFCTASSLFAVYTLSLLFSPTSQLMKQHNFSVKFICIQCVMIVCQLQHSILSLLAEKGVIPCKDPFNSTARADDIHNVLVIPEMLVLLIVSTLVNSTAVSGNASDDTSDDESQPLLIS